MSNENKNTSAQRLNDCLDATAAGVDSLDLVAIFSLCLQETLHKFFEQTARYFLLPIVALSNILRTIFAWRRYALDGGQTHTLVATSVETLSTLAIVTAVVLGLAISTLSAIIPPLIFTGALIFKSIYNALATSYYLGKSIYESNQQEKRYYQENAIVHGVTTLSNVLAVTAVITVMVLLSKPILAIFGIAAGVLGIGTAIYKACTPPSSKPATLLTSHKEHKEIGTDMKFLSGTMLSLYKNLKPNSEKETHPQQDAKEIALQPTDKDVTTQSKRELPMQLIYGTEDTTNQEPVPCRMVGR